MQVYINGKVTTLQQAKGLQAVLDAEHISDTRGIAIAVNNTVIPAAQWDSYSLNENDKVLIIRAAQGG